MLESEWNRTDDLMGTALGEFGKICAIYEVAKRESSPLAREGNSTNSQTFSRDR
jgi:hypothetical protein